MTKHDTGARLFTGFSRQAFSFLKDLKANNDKAWFKAHRPDYEQYLLQPLRDLVTDLTDAMLDIDPCFEVSPTVNKTISRIHRDTRFSKDKSPYRDCMWIVFKRSGKEWSRWGVGYFIEITPTGYRYGVGFYEAAPDIMAQFRARIDGNPKAFLKAVSWFQEATPYALEGETYKRHKGPDKPEPILSWYNHKTFYLSSKRKIDRTIKSSTLVEILMHDCKLCAPLYHYLRETILETKQM